MRTMKKVLAFGLASMLAVGMLTGCGKKETKDDSDKVYKIGVTQLVEHPALDASYEGFIEGLKEAGYEEGKNLEIDYNNAQNNQDNLQTIASKLAKNNNDLILAIATPSAQTVANATKDTPILVTAVTDLKDAKLVKSNEEPGTNVSGTSDLTPCEAQMDLLKKLLPDAKKVAMLYCSAESNSKFQVELATKAAKKLGLETTEATVADANDVKSVVAGLKGKVDVIYAPTDNTIANAMATVSQTADEIGIPCIVGEEGMCNNGGLATYGLDYKALGKQTAAMAVKVLKGADVSKMPVEFQKDCVLTINKDAVKKFNVKVPEDLDKEATYVTTKSVKE